MESSDQLRAARRSLAEWLFQLTTITIGVLIALSFDALLRWNADRTLVAEARTTLVLEITDNRNDLDAHLATFDERKAKIDDALKLLAELDAGTEPTIRSVDFGISFPSLSDAGWLTAERTGALALMEYPEVQQFAQVYQLQALFTDTLPPALVAVQRAGAILNATADPFAMPPAAREALRAQVLELRAYLELAEALGRQLLDGYAQLPQQRQLR
jgi:hypothetical protein